jgi:hypothetical protein
MKLIQKNLDDFKFLGVTYSLQPAKNQSDEKHYTFTGEPYHALCIVAMQSKERQIKR